MSEVIDCFVLREALQAAGIRASVPAITPWDDGMGEWIAVVSLFDESFHGEAAVRAAFELLGLRVEWIQHDLYSRFNRTAGGVDEGGGKTWNVIFSEAESASKESQVEGPASRSAAA